MILSDRTIKKLLANGELGIDPLDPAQIQPASVDATLGTHFLLVDTPNTAVLHMDEEIKYREIEAEEITIPPHSFLLATTNEYYRLPDNLSAFVEGRSSIGRMGLFIQNAGWVDSGFEGRITLELYNANALPIRLVAGRRVCQMVFCQMDHPSEFPYRGKYYKQDKSVGSRVFLDKDIKQS
ncbi:dCTP deaminase [bacterium]|jgi:dCTP deaminase|nr:dCTP deaminase [bacterium]